MSKYLLALPYYPFTKTIKAGLCRPLLSHQSIYLDSIKRSIKSSQLLQKMHSLIPISVLASLVGAAYGAPVEVDVRQTYDS